ncbi:MAG: hypothetical protein ACHQT7_01515, partial [Candidatus Levyibacteriota bacterium]
LVAIIVTSASVGVLLSSSKNTDKVYQGSTTYDVAESGAETAMLKLLRNPSYTGETLTVGAGTDTITITGTNPKTIVSTGTLNNFTRSVQVTVDTSNNVLTVTSWKQL